MKPKTINIPPDHGITGELHPPILLDPDLTPDIWTIINNSGCTLQFKLWSSIFGNSNAIGAETITINPDNYHTYSTQEILDLFGEGSGSYLTNSSLNVMNSNGTLIGNVYPNQQVRISNGGCGECDCVYVNWDVTNRTITITSCQ